MEFELRVLWLAIGAYIFSGLLAVVGAAMRKRLDAAVLSFMVLGIALHTASLAIRWERLGYGPFMTLFEILSSNVWGLMLAFAIAYWRIPKIRPVAAVVMPMLFVMMGWLMLAHPGEGHFPPTFNTPWLWVHVGFAKCFIGTLLVASGVAGIVLLRYFRPAQRIFASMPDDARLEELSFRLQALSLVFNSLMLITGAIWAQDAWGRYWAWDPLETWSFLTWLLLALAVHVRITYCPRPRRGAWLTVAVFVMAFLTFFGVPFISEVTHQGAV